MIDCIIVSKNRACQLDLLLRSILDNFKEIPTHDIYVLYKYTDVCFKLSYDKIIKKYPKINFSLERQSYMVEFTNIIKKLKNKYIVCFSDDEVVIRSNPIMRAINFLEQNKNIFSCISLRMGADLYSEYTGNNMDVRFKKPDDLIILNDFVIWKWHNQVGEYSNCASASGHIYENIFFKDLVDFDVFNTPNQLETNMNKQKNKFKPYMFSFLKTKILNLPINRVSDAQFVPFGRKHFQSVLDLNDKFLNGYIIDTKNIYNYNNTTAHDEIKFDFIKE